MRKLIVVIVILLLVGCVQIAYAEIQTEDEGAETLGVEFLKSKENLVIDATGKGTFSSQITFMDSTDVDRVKVSITVTKSSSGAVVYSISDKLMTASSGGKYTFSDNFRVSSKGTYKMQVYYKCYDGSKLLEAVIANPKTVTY